MFIPSVLFYLVMHYIDPSSTMYYSTHVRETSFNVLYYISTGFSRGLFGDITESVTEFEVEFLRQSIEEAKYIVTLQRYPE